LFKKVIKSKNIFTSEDSKELYRIAILFRFIFLFAIACAIGVLMVQVSMHGFSLPDNISSHFLSFAPISVTHFFKNLLHTSLCDLTLLAISGLSALTFFCPAVLHLIGIIGGCMYGFCIGSIVNSDQIQNSFIVCYIGFVFAFALLYTKASTELSCINQRCLERLRCAPNKKKLYISKEIKSFLKIVLKITLSYFAIRFLYCLLLTLINIKIN
jgi:hypothetical protein